MILCCEMLNLLISSPLSTGFLIYFGYGVRNSVQKQRLKAGKVNIETISAKTDIKDIMKEEKF